MSCNMLSILDSSRHWADEIPARAVLRSSARFVSSSEGQRALSAKRKDEVLATVQPQYKRGGLFGKPKRAIAHGSSGRFCCNAEAPGDIGTKESG